MKKTLRYAGSAVTVEYTSGRPEEIVEFLFGSVPEDLHDTRPPLSGYSLQEGEEQGSLVLSLDGAPIYAGNNEGELAELLLSAVCHDLAERSRGGLLIQAATLEWRGKTVILAGDADSGKTMLALWMAARGPHFLGDEMVSVDPQCLKALPFIRPLKLEATSRTALRKIFDFEANSDRMIATPGGDLIPPDLFGPGAAGGDLPAGLLLFPHYVPGGEPSLQNLSKAQAALELMQCLVNARNFPDHGFKAAATLGRTVPASRLVYGSLDRLAAQIDPLLEAM